MPPSHPAPCSPAGPPGPESNSGPLGAHDLDVRSVRGDVLVEAEQVVGVPFVLQRGQPAVLGLAVGGADPVAALPVEEVDVDAVAVRPHGLPYPPSPGGLLRVAVPVRGPWPRRAGT